MENAKTAAEMIKKEIEKAKEAAIAVHHNADPDAIGSAVALARALAQFKVKCTVLAPADISRQSMALLAKYPYPVQKSAQIGELIFIVDSSSPEQVPIQIPEKSTVVLIDHHEHGALAKRANIAVINPSTHSTAGIVLSVLRELGAELTREIRFFLLAGIIADTAFLRHASRDELKTVVELSEDIEIESVFSALSITEEISERIAKLEAAKRLDTYRIGDVVLAFSRVGSFESQSALSFVKTGADVAAVFNVQKDEIRISGRMRAGMPPEVSLADAFAKLAPVIKGGAGGHRTAASANGRDTKSADAAKYALVSYFEKALGKKAKKIG